jgi:hypothetical protein
MTEFTPSLEQAQLSEEKDSPWEASSVANLVRWKKSRVYFARLRVNGKLIRKSLKTTLFSVAKNRLADLVKWKCQHSQKRTNGISPDKKRHFELTAIKFAFWPPI